MARVEIWETLIDGGGRPFDGEIEVTLARTTDPATVYTTEGGGGVLTQPFSTVNGMIPGWVEEGEYDLYYSGVGIADGGPVRFNAIVGGNPALAPNQVTETELADNSVGPDQIQAGAVGASELADDSVGNAELQNNAVAQANMQDDSVGNAELQNNAVAQANMQDDSVGNAELQDNAVAQANMQDDSVGDAELVSPRHSIYRVLQEWVNEVPASDSASPRYASHSDSFQLLTRLRLIRLLAADFAAEGKTTRLRLRARQSVFGTPPGETLTLGLYPVLGIFAGDYLIDPVVTGSTITFPNPAAHTLTEGTSGDFDLPADGLYVVGVALSGATDPGSVHSISWQLQLHHT